MKWGNCIYYRETRYIIHTVHTSPPPHLTTHSMATRAASEALIIAIIAQVSESHRITWPVEQAVARMVPGRLNRTLVGVPIVESSSVAGFRLSSSENCSGTKSDSSFVNRRFIILGWVKGRKFRWRLYEAKISGGGGGSKIGQFLKQKQKSLINSSEQSPKSTLSKKKSPFHWMNALTNKRKITALKKQ